MINRYLRAIDIHSIIYIPDRVDEGYGLNTDALLQLKKNGIDLCISVDCGTLAYQPIEDAKAFGLDIIVVDHHLGTEKLPSAVAVVNPNRLDESSPYNNLAAVGVSFLLIVALNKSLREQGFLPTKKNQIYLICWIWLPWELSVMLCRSQASIEHLSHKD